MRRKSRDGTIAYYLRWYEATPEGRRKTKLRRLFKTEARPTRASRKEWERIGRVRAYEQPPPGSEAAWPRQPGYDSEHVCRRVVRGHAGGGQRPVRRLRPKLTNPEALIFAQPNRRPLTTHLNNWLRPWGHRPHDLHHRRVTQALYLTAASRLSFSGSGHWLTCSVMRVGTAEKYARPLRCDCRVRTQPRPSSLPEVR